MHMLLSTSFTFTTFSTLASHQNSIPHCPEDLYTDKHICFAISKITNSFKMGVFLIYEKWIREMR